ncbi:MAG: xanthine dehydrogenase family protein molybdopterin-binding subunit [Betaproteobacteria bacterium]
MGQFGIGQPVSRFEDPRLLRGQGRYINDLNLPGQACLVYVRSPHPHADIRAIDLAAAAAAPGVLGVYTAADLRADGLGTSEVALKRKRTGGAPMFWKSHLGLAEDRVRHVGDPVVAVVAETLMQARDAAELVVVDYADRPSVTRTAATVLPGAASVWDECPDNVCNVHEVGDQTASDAAFASAAHVIKGSYTITRVHSQYMETRGALGSYDAGEDRYTLECDSQYPHRIREVLAREVFRIPEHRIRVVSGNVGGAFGGKGWAYTEHRLVLWLARKLGRPVKWACDRSEALLADEHSRDCVSEAELALDAGGKFLALRVRTLCNVGAYVSSDRQLLPTFSNIGSLVGVYGFRAAHVRVSSVFSNTNSTGPYRGAGRPEAIYVIERIVDEAAAALGIDRVELRRRNMLPASAFPYKTALTFTYDCGDFHKGLDDALVLGDYAGFAERRKESAARGKLRGLGIANAIERAGAPGMEYAEIRFEPGGTATVLMGSKDQGQGHDTTFRLIASQRLGLPPEEFRFIDGDTDKVAYGTGTFGSRSTAIGGSALVAAADKIIAKGSRIAAHMLEAGEADVVFADGRFTIAGTDRGINLKEVAMASLIQGKLPPGITPGLIENGSFTPSQETFPNSCHLCEVEIDPDTGEVQLANYAVVDDVGTVINPLTLKGQVHGGIVQGVSQILMERVVYDPESGQLITGSFMDYAMPRATDICTMEVGSNPVPTKLNPLGVKGAGEAGTVGALAAAMNAILDALAPLGVKDIEMPATSERVWQAIRQAGARP